ncbi:zinc ribbon domain-containing protein [Planctomycetota bacterium]
MPAYDYFCPANSATIEVRHGMSARMQTWGDICEDAGIDLGDTSADAPVERCISGGFVITKRRGGGSPGGSPGGSHCGSCSGSKGCCG